MIGMKNGRNSNEYRIKLLRIMVVICIMERILDGYMVVKVLFRIMVVDRMIVFMFFMVYSIVF